MSLEILRDRALYRANFANLGAYFDFAQSYLHFMDDRSNYQAEIVCQNERSYRFYQYKSDGNHRITRPINNDLWLPEAQYIAQLGNFRAILDDLQAGRFPNPAHKTLVSRYIYTTQQTVGAALDSLDADRVNTARKLNGDVFEQFIKQLIQATGVDCESGVVKVPIRDEHGAELFKVQYQHDLLVRSGDDLKIIGSVKTSSKDRLDKIFVDKFLYSQITGTDTPHIAICLNDVQRGKRTAGTSTTSPTYRVGSTFLPGRFKAYTIKLSALDGVYYCDLRPNMSTDPLLSAHIKSIDDLFYGDLTRFLKTAPPAPVEVELGAELHTAPEISD
ncbi:hypothetical protein [Deinococcus sp.]|uniref:hypothetical protein n=1 Tax=Deinococcus sp. TaxID=47478 RepID=UPI003CC55E6B